MSTLGGYGPDFKPILGTEEATIDAKGRILVAKKRRERLGDGFAITIGKHGCLVAYPAPAWRKMVAKYLEDESLNPELDGVTRDFLGSADDDLSFDPQGRVVIPSKIRDHAKLKTKVTIVGVGDRMEIWAKEEYDSYNARRRANSTDAETKSEG